MRANDIETPSTTPASEIRRTALTSRAHTRRWRLAVSCVLAIALAGCGGRSELAGADTAQEEQATAGGEVNGAAAQPALAFHGEDLALVESYHDDMAGLTQELSDAMTLGTGIDCDLASLLEDRICDLSDRICDIARRHPDNEGVTAKCSDGQDRCERAGDSVAESCRR